MESPKMQPPTLASQVAASQESWPSAEDLCDILRRCQKIGVRGGDLSRENPVSEEQALEQFAELDEVDRVLMLERASRRLTFAHETSESQREPNSAAPPDVLAKRVGEGAETFEDFAQCAIATRYVCSPGEYIGSGRQRDETRPIFHSMHAKMLACAAERLQFIREILPEGMFDLSWDNFVMVGTRVVAKKHSSKPVYFRFHGLRTPEEAVAILERVVEALQKTGQVEIHRRLGDVVLHYSGPYKGDKHCPCGEKVCLGPAELSLVFRLQRYGTIAEALHGLGPSQIPVGFDGSRFWWTPKGRYCCTRGTLLYDPDYENHASTLVENEEYALFVRNEYLLARIVPGATMEQLRTTQGQIRGKQVEMRWDAESRAVCFHIGKHYKEAPGLENARHHTGRDNCAAVSEVDISGVVHRVKDVVQLLDDASWYSSLKEDSAQWLQHWKKTFMRDAANAISEKVLGPCVAHEMRKGLADLAEKCAKRWADGIEFTLYAYKSPLGARYYWTGAVPSPYGVYGEPAGFAPTVVFPEEQTESHEVQEEHLSGKEELGAPTGEAGPGAQSDYESDYVIVNMPCDSIAPGAPGDGAPEAEACADGTPEAEAPADCTPEAEAPADGAPEAEARADGARSGPEAIARAMLLAEKYYPSAFSKQSKYIGADESLHLEYFAESPGHSASESAAEHFRGLQDRPNGEPKQGSEQESERVAPGGDDGEPEASDEPAPFRRLRANSETAGRVSPGAEESDAPQQARERKVDFEQVLGASLRDLAKAIADLTRHLTQEAQAE